MQTFKNTVTIQRPPRRSSRSCGLREHPDVELRQRTDQQGFRRARRGGHPVPPDRFGSWQEHREFRGHQPARDPKIKAAVAQPSASSSYAWKLAVQHDGLCKANAIGTDKAD